MDVTVSAVITALLHVLLNYGKSGGGELVEPIAVLGLEYMRVKLPCAMPHADTPPRVQWFDFVYNSNPEPIRIFDSSNNSNRQIDDLHPNRHNYEVNSDMTLTINSLRYRSDPGLYFCRRTYNDTFTDVTSYDLTVAWSPVCDVSTGRKALQVGDVTVLWCRSSYSGSRPVLDWYRADSRLTSIDRSDVRLARRDIRLRVSHEDDNETFRCQLTFNDVVEQCTITLHVIYAVRNASFVVIGNATSETVTSSVMYAGDELECRALGNPEPAYNFTTEPTSALDEMVVNASRGHVRLKSSLIGRNLTLHCSAVNVIDSMSYSDNVSVTFAVLERRSAEPSTVEPRSSHSHTSDVDSNPGIVIAVVIVIALSLLAVVAGVVLVRRRRELQQRKAAAAAKAETNRNHQATNASNS